MDFRLCYDVETWDLPEALFLREFAKRGYSHCVSVAYETETRTFGEPDGFGRVLVQKSDEHEYVVFLFGDALVYGWIGRGRIEVRIAGDEDMIAEVEARIRAACPQVETEDRHVTYRFWYLDSSRSKKRERSIEVPDWDDIANNYNRDSRDQLETMLEAGPPVTGGSLSLWHGPTGTGKTFAVRALSWAWRDWCDFEYVVDPERFFASAEYMLNVLLGESDDDRWRLLILEDGGDMLRLDAKDGTTHGLSRLLNVADGLIGQGLKVQFLITTNEPMGTLHPAVTRPGRCAFQVEFRPLTYAEASRWMGRHGRALPERAAYTLADLFGICDGTAAARAPERKLGFIA